MKDTRISKFKDSRDKLIVRGLNIKRSTSEDYHDLLRQFLKWDKQIKKFLNIFRIDTAKSYVFYSYKVLPIAAELEVKNAVSILLDRTDEYLSILSRIQVEDIGKDGVVNQKKQIQSLAFVVKNITSLSILLVVNGDYDKPFTIDTKMNGWRRLLDLARNKGVGPEYEGAKGFYDYFNSNNHKLVGKNTRFAKTKILTKNGKYICLNPKIKTEEITRPLFERRKNEKRKVSA